MQDHSAILTDRWYPLKYHAEQNRYFTSKSRFCIAHAGRRGGKSEIAKRRQIIRAMYFEKPQGRFVFAAPTHRQAVGIFWDDVVAMVPRWALYNQSTRSISLSYRRIKLYNGACLEVFGLDKPERIEGPPLDGIVCDEQGNMKSTVWHQNVRPALSTLDRPGNADLIGVPEGRNHYFQLAEDAKDKDDWSVFTWELEEINPEEAAIAKAECDDKVFDQEYRGYFVSFAGKCYYAFDASLNTPPNGERILYHKNFPLDLCFDFNRVPGNCIASQELPAPDWLLKRNQGRNKGMISCAIDEIFFKQDSHTGKICDELIKRWRHHKGVVNLYGDATGGQKRTVGIAGSDWDIINDKLAPHFQLNKQYPIHKPNPPVRTRINNVNSRMVSADGYIGTIIDRRCKFLIRDFESVTCNDDGSITESDKRSLLTHVSDAWGYKISITHPLGGGVAFSNMEY